MSSQARPAPPALLIVACKVLLLMALGFDLATIVLPNHGRGTASVGLAVGLQFTNPEGWYDFNPIGLRRARKKGQGRDQAKILRAEPEIVTAGILAAFIANCAVLFDTSSTPYGPNAFYLTYVVQTILAVPFILQVTWSYVQVKGTPVVARGFTDDPEETKTIRWIRITAKYYLPIVACMLCIAADVYCVNVQPPLAAYVFYGRALPHLTDTSDRVVFLLLLLAGLTLAAWSAAIDGTGITWGLLGIWGLHAALYLYVGRCRSRAPKGEPEGEGAPDPHTD